MTINITGLCCICLDTSCVTQTLGCDRALTPRSRTSGLGPLRASSCLAPRWVTGTVKSQVAEPHKYFVEALRELDVFHVLDALDETINPIPRDDKDPVG